MPNKIINRVEAWMDKFGLGRLQKLSRRERNRQLRAYSYSQTLLPDLKMVGLGFDARQSNRASITAFFD